MNPHDEAHLLDGIDDYLAHKAHEEYMSDKMLDNIDKIWKGFLSDQTY